MRAGVWTGVDEPLSIEEVAPLAPGPNDAVVAIDASGVCHTDHAVLHGQLPWAAPAILGHEVTGMVVEVGSNVTRVAVGDRADQLRPPSLWQLLLVCRCPAAPVRADVPGLCCSACDARRRQPDHALRGTGRLRRQHDGVGAVDRPGADRGPSGAAGADRLRDHHGGRLGLQHGPGHTGIHRCGRRSRGDRLGGACREPRIAGASRIFAVDPGRASSAMPPRCREPPTRSTLRMAIPWSRSSRALLGGVPITPSRRSAAPMR